MPSTSRPALAAAALLVLLPACSGSDAPTTTGSTATASATAAVPDELRFTFTGETGEAGCRYDGPGTVRTGALSVLENRSQEEARVTLARLAPDASPADFDAYLATLGDTPPLLAPEADHDPAVHDWMQGFWIQVHAAAPGATQPVTSPVTEAGEYVAFCVQDAPGGSSAIWPVGHVSVTRG